ncbi:hypothetical protein HYH02_007542 [Chlamydomonas schloesseri]|uniref:Uncharacterized protein n=1 Tax=Chlamydomonas schloesseri TaxID=2026947 RepID=A0A836B568_9CHLO|nr:hypothetical protein HYH02_007542 [Chlamydomonas schloesseri]|eukprot:KAG2447624.1 hypothetical protein HYH02_007542 [Chlamydomonas schloesseri]
MQQKSPHKRSSREEPPGEPRLPPELLHKVALDYLHANDVAGSFKLLNRDAAACLRERFRLLTLGVRRTSAKEPHQAQQPWPAREFVAHWGRPEPWHALSLTQRRRLLCLAASSGHPGSLEAALAHCGSTMESVGADALVAAAAAGGVDCCRLLLAAGCGSMVDAGRRGLEAAAKAGHTPVLQLLMEGVNEEAAFSCYDAACAGGQISTLAWLRRRLPSWSAPCTREAVKAAKGGHVALLEQVLMPHITAFNKRAAEAGYGGKREASRRGVRQDRWRLLNAIAKGCPVGVFRRHYHQLWVWGSDRDMERANQYVPRKRIEARNEAMASLLTAAASSATACWAAKVDLLLSAWGPAVAAEVLQMRRGRHCAVEEAAARPDYCQRLRHLHAAGMPLFGGEDACAAKHGHADALVYLWDERRLPLRLDESFVHKFVRGRGKEFQNERLLAVLQLLRERGVAWNFAHMGDLVLYGGVIDAPVLLWLARTAVNAYGPTSGPWTSTALHFAAVAGASLQVLQALRARGASVCMSAVAEGGGVAALQWAALQVLTDGHQLEVLSSIDVEGVCRAGNTAALEWLHAHRFILPADVQKLRVRGLLPPAG